MEAKFGQWTQLLRANLTKLLCGFDPKILENVDIVNV